MLLADWLYNLHDDVEELERGRRAVLSRLNAIAPLAEGQGVESTGKVLD
ncbi:MAG: hypothetical protein M5U23_10415 [Acidimicrobiia bacterium]|nr:hypothetical protein [Acidimicrobiia bacterium]